MHLCYIDESGDTSSLISATSPLMPALVVGAIVIPDVSLYQLTIDFLSLKRNFFPSISSSSKTPRFLEGILTEIKGSDLRKNIALGTKKEKRHAIGFLDKTIDLISKHNVRLFGRIGIKDIGVSIDETSMYTASVQYIHNCFQRYLSQLNSVGIVIADSRSHAKNVRVSHSIFTQKFKVGGDAYNRILDLPSFGHSENHAGIQIADLVFSGIFFPMAVHSYCTGYVYNLHVRSGYNIFKPRYASRIDPLLFRFTDATGRWRGGMTVDDKLGKRPSGLLFR